MARQTRLRRIQPVLALILLRRIQPVLALILLATLLTAGCIESAHPVYDKQTVVFKPELVGTWSEDDSSWTFAKRDEQSYTLVIKDEKGNDLPFIAHLAEVDGALFLDLYPDKLDETQKTFYDFHLFPVHSIFLVKEIGDQLKLGVMNYKELKQQLASNPQSVEHVTVEQRVLLTAPTKPLQKFLHGMQHAFSGDAKLSRKAS
jgi:hypothetical protein